MNPLLDRYAHAGDRLADAIDLAGAAVDEAEEMACFDQLPPPLRAALVEHPIKITAQSTLGRWSMFARRFGEADAARRVADELAALRTGVDA